MTRLALPCDRSIVPGATTRTVVVTPTKPLINCSARCASATLDSAVEASVRDASSATGLPRIVSMNVCSDQLLLTLADPEQILGLSRYARDGWQSWAADKARMVARAATQR